MELSEQDIAKIELAEVALDTMITTLVSVVPSIKEDFSRVHALAMVIGANDFAITEALEMRMFLGLAMLKLAEQRVEKK